MHPIVERVNGISHFLWILNDVEDRAKTNPNVKAFLIRWYDTLQDLPIEDVSQINDIGSHLRRLGSGPFARRNDIAVKLVKEQLGPTSRDMFFRDMLGSAYLYAKDDFQSVIDSMIAQIGESSDEELVENFDVARILKSSTYVSDEVVDLILKRIHEFSDTDIVSVDIQGIIEALTTVDMQSGRRPPSPYHERGEKLAVRIFEAFENLNVEELFASKNFSGNLRAPFTIWNRRTPETRLISDERVTNVALKLELYLSSLSPEQLDVLDPDSWKSKAISNYRTVLGDTRLREPPVRSPFDSAKPIDPDFMDRAQRALEESVKPNPVLLFSAGGFRELLNAGQLGIAQQLIENYIGLPDEAFVDYNPVRLFDVLNGRDGATTLVQAKEQEKLPKPFDPELLKQLREKLVQSFFAKEKILAGEIPENQIRFILESDSELYYQGVIPRLYLEVFGEPMQRGANSPILPGVPDGIVADPNVIGRDLK